VTDQAEIIATPIPDHIDPKLVIDFDLFGDHRFVETGHPYDGLLRLIAETGPGIFWTPRNGGHWFITDHEMLFEAARMPELFSNANASFPAVPPEQEAFLPPLNIDPPEHGKYRLPLMRAFAPANIRALDGRIRQTARDLIEPFVDRGHCDFFREVSELLPLIIFMTMMGLDLSRLHEFREWAIWMSEADIERRTRGFNNAIEMTRPLFDERRIQRQDDVLSRLLDDQIEGRPLTQREMEGMCTLLLGAGLDTVVNSMSFSMEYLAHHPALQDRLRADPSLIPEAVEEFLRRFAVAFPFRSIAKDRTFHGATLKAGERMAMSVALGNLDSAAFPDAATVDIDRANKAHMTFNSGPHRCIGSHLARTELVALFDEWLKLMPNVRPDPARRPTYRTGLSFAITALPLVWNVG